MGEKIGWKIRKMHLLGAFGLFRRIPFSFSRVLDST